MPQLSKRPNAAKSAAKAPPAKADLESVGVLGDDMLVIDARSLQVLSPGAVPQGAGVKVYKVRGKGGEYFIHKDLVQVSGSKMHVTKVGSIKKSAGKASARTAQVFYGGGAPFDVETVRRVLGITLGSIRQAENLQQPLTETEVLKQVSRALAAEAAEVPAESTPEAGWEALLLRGLEYKRNLLASNLFKSTGEAAALLGVGDAAVRKRVREGKLFALQMQHNDEYRIPIWALGIGDAARALASVEPDPWGLYHFLATPSGALNGLRPFELLLSQESLTAQQLADRTELAQYRQVPAQGPFLDLVLQTLAADKSEALGAA